MDSMLGKILIVILLVKVSATEDDEAEFIYNRFYSGNLSTDGAANITQNGLLQLTTAEQSQIGHAFYPKPLSLKISTNGNVNTFSFSSTFVFAIVPKNSDASGNGLAFVLSPSKELETANSGSYLGLFNISSNGYPSNHIAAIEFDTAVNKELGDINDNHIGIDINSLMSVNSSPAGYYSDENGGFTNVTLMSSRRFQVWVEYDGGRKQLNVTMAPVQVPKPKHPLLSLRINLSSVITDPMYVGFSASTATLRSFHYVLGWSFKMNGEAPPLDIARLPKVPGPKKSMGMKTMGMIIGVSSAAAVSVSILIICGIVYKLKRRKRFAEVLEEWERQIGAHRIPYKDLHKATKGFQDSKVIGVGGFGKVYEGILPSSKIEVAVKKVSHDSEEGMRQFLAEITSLGRLRSPNFVELLGYCRRKGELLLVYEFMNNGSLDKLLYDEPCSTLNWNQRFQIIKQVATGLFYLHEKWAQAILHRDIKPGNVLLDDKFNGKLGDFGLSRLYDHGSDPHTTRLVGTVGYMAPELSRTGKATKASDVYAFGVLMLEVVCGRRPMDHRAPPNMIMLVDWVFDCLKEGGLFNVVDPKLGTSFQIEELEEVETVLKLGLLCSHDSAGDRPTIGEVIQFLNKDLPLPEVPIDSLRTGSSVPISTPEGSENLLISSPSIGSVSILIGGR